MSRPKNEELIEKTAIIEIGTKLRGTHWRAEVARELKYSKSFITRAATAARSPDEKFLESLRLLMIGTVDDMGRLLGTKGLPFSNTPETKEARKMIRHAIKLLRSQYIPVKRVEI